MKRVFMYIIALILLTAVLPKQPACAEAMPRALHPHQLGCPHRVLPVFLL